jgi:hypothetical protein
VQAFADPDFDAGGSLQYQSHGVKLKAGQYKGIPVRIQRKER